MRKVVVMVNPDSILSVFGIRSLRDADGAPIFSPLDIEIAEWIRSDFGSAGSPWNDLIGFAAACINKAVRDGHTCLDLSHAPAFLHNHTGITWPDTGTWAEALKPFLADPDQPEPIPIVYEPPHHAFFHTYWKAENDLVNRFMGESTLPFQTQESDIPDWITAIPSQGQREAIQAPFAHPIVILNGGPGTGKTWTILRSIRAILERNPDAIIRIAAPTGKAVARVTESIRNGLRSLQGDPGLMERIPTEASTIHRLLHELESTEPDRNWIPVLPSRIDWLILDEASMIDLKLIHHLLSLLPPHCKLMLVGDVNQLSSVQPGAVFADIHAAVSQTPASYGQPVSITLKDTFRYASDSPLHRLCEAIRVGDVQGILDTLQKPDPSIQWVSPSGSGSKCSWALDAWMDEHILPYALAHTPDKAIRRLDHALCLAATHDGPFGVRNLNARISRKIRETTSSGIAWEPVMITRNTPDMSLYNGDMGVRRLQMPFSYEPNASCWFPAYPDGLRAIPSSHIPETISAHAITIHKSQGSEADHVCVLLPEAPSPLLTRELLYTAASRAKKTLMLIAIPEALQTASDNLTNRHTRLFDRLQKALTNRDYS